VIIDHPRYTPHRSITELQFGVIAGEERGGIAERAKLWLQGTKGAIHNT
jgi:hypothetical protein